MSETNPIRALQAADRPALEAMLKKTDIFYGEEVSVALELIDIALSMPGQEDYHLYVYEHEGSVAGYHCTGKRPLTDGVFDLYWIVVAPDTTGSGIGSALLHHAEQFVQAQKGRWILAETSSRKQYDKTRNFYKKHHYQVLAHIPDFYKPGDGMVVYGKHFAE